MADDQVNRTFIEREHNEMNPTQPTVPVDTLVLRTAPPLPEADIEERVEEIVEEVEEEEEEVEEEEVEEEEVEEEEEEEQSTALVYVQRYGIQALLWLNTLWSFVSQVVSTTHAVSRGVLRSLQSQVFVSFKGSPSFYRMQDYNLTGPGVAPVEWYYNAGTKQFASSLVYNTAPETLTRHFEWLSGQIKYNDLVLYDITEFLQQIRWAGVTRPSMSHILSAWSLDSGIVLNSVDGLTLQVIKEDGTEAALACRGERA